MTNIAKSIFGDVTQEELTKYQDKLLKRIEQYEYHRDEPYHDVPNWITSIGEPLEVIVAKELLGKLAIQYTTWNEWDIENWGKHKCYPYGENGDSRTMRRTLVANANVFDYDTGSYIYDESPAWIAIDLDLLKDHGLVFVEVYDNINNYNLVGFLPLNQLLKMQAKRSECLCHIPDPIDEFDD